MSFTAHTLVVLGGGGVGKSALTIRLVTNNYSVEYDPTIEDTYRKEMVVDEQTARLDILDTSGQEQFKSMQDQWIQDGHGFLLVYSITDKIGWDELKTFHGSIFHIKGVDKVPIVLVGNKCDLESERKVQKSDGEALARQWNCPFFETSAKEKINLEACFSELVREIRKQNPTLKKKKKLCAIL